MAKLSTSLEEGKKIICDLVGIDISLMKNIHGFFADQIEKKFLQRKDPLLRQKKIETAAQIKKRIAFAFPDYGTTCVVVFEESKGYFNYWFY